MVVLSQSAALADYHLERITPILNQPTFVTQAPGDPPNILYYSTRITSTGSGFGAVNTMGGIWRYDLNTRVSTLVFAFTNRNVINDDGLQTFAFHPDFYNVGTVGFGKMYVSTSEQQTTSLNRVEEFRVLNPDGTFKTPASAFVTARNILRYLNSAQNNHTVDWVGFDPNATGSNRNYLYISTGDGSFGNIYNFGSGTNGRPSQNPNDVKGKILRVDISGGDDYPLDSAKNFAIPPSNPIPTYNAAHPGSPISGLGEVYVTGVRNGYRMSFDRANSDMYWGDVGEDTYEEVNFLKAGSNTLGPPVDYGWPQLEGVHNSTIGGAPHTTTNPFTGAISLYPIREYTHATGQCSVGGYKYRGPIPELQGKYFSSDFVAGRVWMLDFDRDTDPATFNGTNGTRTEMTFTWSTNIYDPANPSYTGDTSLATVNGLDHIVSFGEDNQGNLYLVDFGFGVGFEGQYTANAGEIYKLVNGPIPQKLNYTRNGSNLHFTWSGNFKLQYQTNGLPGGTWTDYPGGGTNVVDVTMDTLQSNVYFRLYWPP
jgi:glucose/arabinose dehydrogenase